MISCLSTMLLILNDAVEGGWRENEKTTRTEDKKNKGAKKQKKTVDTMLHAHELKLEKKTHEVERPQRSSTVSVLTNKNGGGPLSATGNPLSPPCLFPPFFFFIPPLSLFSIRPCTPPGLMKSPSTPLSHSLFEQSNPPCFLSFSLSPPPSISVKSYVEG